MPKRFPFLFACFLLYVFLRFGAEAAEPSRYEEERMKMGTAVRITLYADSPDAAREAFESGFRRFDEIEASMSDYDADSEIIRLAIAADGDAEPVWRPVSGDLFTVLAASKEMGTLSDGAFDITVAPLTKLWRRARRLHALPPPKMLDKAKRLVGFEAIELDAEQRRVRLTRPGMRVDLGGIAKGYAIDAAFEAIRERGIETVLVDAGGDMRFGNPPPVSHAENAHENNRQTAASQTAGATGWNIGLVPRGKEGKPLFHRRMRHRAVAVSGATFRFAEIDGVRYSHLVDPKTGIGLTEQLVVTVVAKEAMQADALASAVSVLGVEKGIALIRSLPDVEVLILEPGKTTENGGARPDRLYSVECLAEEE